MLEQDSARPPKTPSKKKAMPAKRAKTTSKKAPSPSTQATTSVSPEQRQQMINEAAYFIAESRGFSPHDCLDCWLEAEAEIDKQLSSTAS